jgi:hypothetical protein
MRNFEYPKSTGKRRVWNINNKKLKKPDSPLTEAVVAKR